MSDDDQRPLVLITNDDGIASDGLIALAKAVERTGARVLVAAPAINMSGAAAAMGPIDPTVRIDRVELDGLAEPCYAVHAPPAMIVIAAINGAFGKRPDAVASGVNEGVNLGRAILHSGTVGAALTGQNLGLPSVAVSLQGGTSWAAAAEFGADVLTELRAADRPRVANVNAPTSVTANSPVVRTRLARFGAVTAAVEGDALDFQMVIDADALDEEGTDAAAVRLGQVSVTIMRGFNEDADTDVDLTLRPVSPAEPREPGIRDIETV